MSSGTSSGSVRSPSSPTPTHVDAGGKLRFVVVHPGAGEDTNDVDIVTPSQWKDVHVVFEPGGVEQAAIALRVLPNSGRENTSLREVRARVPGPFA